MGRGLPPAQRRGAGTGAIATLLAAALFLTLLVPGSGAADEEVLWARIPLLDVGDHWTFEIKGRESGSIRNEIEARETATNHFGVVADTLRARSTGTVVSDQAPGLPTRTSAADTPPPFALATTTHEIDAKKWVRLDDHAVVETAGTVRVQGLLTSDVLESFDPPLVHTFYPFATGYEWSARAKWYLERGAEDPQENDVTLSANVISYERITVPAGTFDAWVIDYASFRTSAWRVIQWWSAEACGIVKEEQYNRDQNLVNTLTLTDYSCSGDHDEEPDYAGRGVTLRSTGGNPPPPWLVDDPPVVEPWEDDAPQRAALLPGGIHLWVAFAMIAAASVLFIAVSRRKQ